MADTQCADEVWPDLLREILTKGMDCKPRGISVREILCHTTKVDMTRCITTKRPKLGYRFLTAEAWWILSGRNDVEGIKPYSPHIASFSDNGFFFSGAYGPRIVDQLTFVIDTLVKDPESRQAVIEIWRPNPRPSKDIPCTLTIQWFLRLDDGAVRLHCVDTMRSSDAWLGWVYDVFNFSMLSAYVALFLRYKLGVSVQLGTLYLTAGSQHLYLHPAEDGQSNIPYNVDDVRNTLILPQCERPYTPLNLDDFSSPQHLVNHLGLLKDRNASGGWMKEFI